MKFYTRKRRSPAVIIVSLIDILAILLIFFIVTTTFKKDQPQLEINLPESRTAAPSEEVRTAPLILEVRGDETVYLDGESVEIGELPDKLRAAREAGPDRSLALAASEEAPFRIVVGVLDALRDAGIKNIPAFTRPQAAEAN